MMENIFYLAMATCIVWALVDIRKELEEIVKVLKERKEKE